MAVELTRSEMLAACSLCSGCLARRVDFGGANVEVVELSMWPLQLDGFREILCSCKWDAERRLCLLVAGSQREVAAVAVMQLKDVDGMASKSSGRGMADADEREEDDASASLPAWHSLLVRIPVHSSESSLWLVHLQGHMSAACFFVANSGFP